MIATPKPMILYNLQKRQRYLANIKQFVIC